MRLILNTRLNLFDQLRPTFCLECIKSPVPKESRGLLSQSLHRSPQDSSKVMVYNHIIPLGWKKKLSPNYVQESRGHQNLNPDSDLKHFINRVRLDSDSDWLDLDSDSSKKGWIRILIQGTTWMGGFGLGFKMHHVSSLELVSLKGRAWYP